MRPARTIALVLCALPLLGMLALSAFAAPPVAIESRPGALITLRAGSANAFTRISRRQPAEGVTTQSATIIVTYNGFSAEAQAAFQYAVDIWETQISSPVPIRVNATWTNLGPGVLGSAGAADFYRDFPGAPQAGTWYPAALADALSGTDLNAIRADITANFSSAFSNWYFGIDGNTPANYYDFVTVVLHELGHGLGFAGSMTVSSGQGRWGGGTPYPIIYDRFTENGAGTSLLATDNFPNPSSALAEQLQSNNIFFDGANATAANGGNRPQLYAPSAWSQGSSYSHLDESAFVAGNSNSLMTPVLTAAESIHDPGTITRGMFRDIGWNASATTPNPTSTPTTTATATATSTTTPGAVKRGYLPLLER